MQRNILILVVYVSFLGVVLAQEKNLSFQVIIDDEQEEHLGSVYLYNPRTKLGSYIDSAGKATISVQINDVVHAQSEFYEERFLLISSNLFQKELVHLHLVLQSIVLDEAKIRSFNFTGNLAQDAKNIGFVDSIGIVYASLGIKEIDVPPPNPAGQKVEKFNAGDVIFLRVRKIIGELNGYNKQQRDIFEYEKHQINIQKIRDKWSDEYFTENLKIPSHKIPEFLFFANESSDIFAKIETNNILEAETVLELYASNYLERLNQQLNFNEK